MLNSSVTAVYSPDSSFATANITVNADHFKLLASISDASFDVGPTFSNLVLSLETPPSMLVDYNIPNQDLRFQFMNKGNILNKEVNMTYTHWRKENRIALDGTLLLDSRNKVSANYEIGTKNCKLRYSYAQDDGARIFEPRYDLASNSWDFSLWQRIDEDNLLKASFESSTNVLGLEWSRTSSCNGSFKVLASLSIAERLRIPKISAESTWNIDM